MNDECLVDGFAGDAGGGVEVGVAEGVGVGICTNNNIINLFIS